MLRAKSTEWKRAFLAVVGGRLTGQGKGRSPDNSLTADFFNNFFFFLLKPWYCFSWFNWMVPINIYVNQNIREISCFTYYYESTSGRTLHSFQPASSSWEKTRITYFWFVLLIVSSHSLPVMWTRRHEPFDVWNPLSFNGFLVLGRIHLKWIKSIPFISPNILSLL